MYSYGLDTWSEVMVLLLEQIILSRHRGAFPYPNSKVQIIENQYRQA